MRTTCRARGEFRMLTEDRQLQMRRVSVGEDENKNSLDIYKYIEIFFLKKGHSQQTGLTLRRRRGLSALVCSQSVFWGLVHHAAIYTRLRCFDIKKWKKKSTKTR